MAATPSSISVRSRTSLIPAGRLSVLGDLDMRLLDPVLGYPFAPQGIAHLDLDAAGEDGEFRTDGNIHIDGGATSVPA